MIQRTIALTVYYDIEAKNELAFDQAVDACHANITSEKIHVADQYTVEYNDSTLYCEWDTDDVDDEPMDPMTDAEADADVLRSAGMGTDEDYGYYPWNDD